MKRLALMASLAAAVSVRVAVHPAVGAPQSPWPDGTRAAVSLSFDDARVSQLTEGVPLFKELGVSVTFYLTAGNLGVHGSEWRQAAAAGHELGNHTMTHPCSGHFPWSRARALEDFTAERIETEMADANRAIAAATGVTPSTFAYPCGQAFYGRGLGAASYVPIVARLFVAGRGYNDETSNDPGVLDPAHVLAVNSDDKTFEQLKPVVDQAVTEGRWLVFAGHDIGTRPGAQVTRVETLRALVPYLKDPARGIWVDTVAHVASRLAARVSAPPPGVPPR